MPAHLLPLDYTWKLYKYFSVVCNGNMEDNVVLWGWDAWEDNRKNPRILLGGKIDVKKFTHNCIFPPQSSLVVSAETKAAFNFMHNFISNCFRHIQSPLSMLLRSIFTQDKTAGLDLHFVLIYSPIWGSKMFCIRHEFKFPMTLHDKCSI